MDSVFTCGIISVRRCSSRFGKSAKVSSVPLNPWMKMRSRSSGSYFVNARPSLELMEVDDVAELDAMSIQSYSKKRCKIAVIETESIQENEMK